MKNYLLIVIILISSLVYAQTGTTLSGSFMSGGISRTYTYYVPAIYYTTNKAVPVVFNLHGFTGNSAAQEIYEDFRTIADTANFIIVHPAGSNLSPTPLLTVLGWNSMGSVASGDADRAFLMSLLDTIGSKLTINTNRVYSAGFSQGGFMSYNLACLHGSRFAAIASASGSLSNENLAACVPAHPTPIMEIHGTADNTIPYAGSGTYMHTDSLVKYWVKYNHCNPVPEIDSFNINTTDNCYPLHYVYKGGDKQSTVELYKIIDGGHQVPSDVATPNPYGVGTRNMDFKASKEIWRFFSKYRLDMSVSIEDPAKEEDYEISVYPNPSNGIFTIDLKKVQNADLTVTDLLGETVLIQHISDASAITTIGTVPSGVYFYQVRSQSVILKSGKLIIQ